MKKYPFYLSEKLLERGMTMGNIAQAVGISLPSLSLIFNGHVEPKRDVEIKLLTLLLGRIENEVKWGSKVRILIEESNEE